MTVQHIKIMEIIRAHVVTSPFGMDLVVLYTKDLPSACPAVTAEPLAVMFHAQAGCGIAYLETNFPHIPFTTINKDIDKR